MFRSASRLILLLAVSSLATPLLAQYHIGLNGAPLFARVAEFTGEYKFTPALSAVLNVGGSANLRQIRSVFPGTIIIDEPLYYVRNRHDRALFAKLGMRVYLFRSVENSKVFSPYFGISVAREHHNRRAILYETDFNGTVIRTSNLNEKGNFWAAVLPVGVSFRVAKRVEFDAGVQMLLSGNRDKILFIDESEYSASLGAYATPIKLESRIQAILVLKYALTRK
jgi:hypothetical protein